MRKMNGRIKQYLDSFFTNDVPAELVREAGGDAAKAAREWIAWWFEENGHESELNVEELRETLDMTPTELEPIVRDWFAEECEAEMEAE